MTFVVLDMGLCYGKIDDLVFLPSSALLYPLSSLPPPSHPSSFLHALGEFCSESVRSLRVGAPRAVFSSVKERRREEGSAMLH